MQEAPIGALSAAFVEIKRRDRAGRLSTEQTAALEETFAATASRVSEILHPFARGEEPVPVAASAPRRVAGKK